jgi:hypothetical protein
MATTNVTVDDSWTLVVSSSSTAAMITCGTPVTLELATTADNSTDPTVIGHAIRFPSLPLTRSQIGTGSIYARIVSGSPETVVVVVNQS